MDIKEILKIIQIFNNSNISYFSLQRNDFNLILSSNNSNINHISSVSNEEIACSKDTQNNNTILKQHTIYSKYVGTISLYNYKTSKSFVVLNQHVHKGDLLAIIQILSLNIEVFAPIDGIISNIYVDNNQFVEYDTKLFDLSN